MLSDGSMALFKEIYVDPVAFKRREERRGERREERGERRRDEKKQWKRR